MSQAAMRQAAVDFLEQYRDEANIYLQVWPSRTKKIATPCAFVETINETIDYNAAAPGLFQRVGLLDIVVLHGYFDGKDTVAKRDAFNDGFLEWTIPLFHAAGANTTFAVVEMVDDPDYTPTWTEEEPRSYFATRITLRRYGEGY